MTTKITTDNILDGTIDAVDMKDSAITNAKLAGSIDVTSKLTGSVPTTNLPTIPVSKGGTGLTSVGDAGQVVQVNSGGSALEFADAAGGGLIHLNTTTVDNAASIIYDNSLITSSHDVYKIVYSNYVPVTTDTTLRLQVSTDNGSNFLAEVSGRRYNHINGTNHANQNNFAAGTNSILMGAALSGTAANGVISGELTVAGVNNTASYKQCWGKAVFNAHGGTDLYWQDNASVIKSASNIDYFKISSTSGNLESGVFHLYGYAKS